MSRARRALRTRSFASAGEAAKTVRWPIFLPGLGVELTAIHTEAAPGLLELNLAETARYAPGVSRASFALGVVCDMIGAPRQAAHYHRRAVEVAEELKQARTRL